MPIDAIVLHFYILVSYLGRRNSAMAPLKIPCRNQRQISRENLFFLEITMFLGRKIDKFGTDSKLFDQVSFRSNVVSIKYRFDQNVVSIKCRFTQVSFDQVSFDHFESVSNFLIFVLKKFKRYTKGLYFKSVPNFLIFIPKKHSSSFGEGGRELDG